MKNFIPTYITGLVLLISIATLSSIGAMGGVSGVTRLGNNPYQDEKRDTVETMNSGEAYNGVAFSIMVEDLGEATENSSTQMIGIDRPVSLSSNNNLPLNSERK
jgi:hypothetical protein